METTEPEWDPESYALMAALADHEAGLCPRCGEPAHESMDPMADPARPGSTHKYVASIRGRCHACDALMVRQRKDSTETADTTAIPRPESLQYGIERVPIDRRPRPERR